MGCSNSVAPTPSANQSVTQGDQMPDSVKAMSQKLGKDFSGELGPCFEGVQHQQCEKLVASFKRVDLPLLEMRSYFVRMPLSTTCLKERLMGKKMQYAEFVTTVDSPPRTWTIHKVFLNDVLPQGQKLGAKVVAEHLTGVAQNDMRELRAVHLSDVVNVNTYMLMVMASSSDRSVKNIFGEHMLAVFQQELSASRITLQQFQTFTLLEVFLCTALGKLLANVLDLWNNTTDREFRIVNADVSMSTTTFEHICGEVRPLLDIQVTLSNSDAWDEVNTGLPDPCDKQTTVSTMASETSASL
jgi:hypothetical protein